MLKTERGQSFELTVKITANVEFLQTVINFIKQFLFSRDCDAFFFINGEEIGSIVSYECESYISYKDNRK